MTTNPELRVPVPTRLSHDIELQFLIAYLNTSDVDQAQIDDSTSTRILRVDGDASTAKRLILSHITAMLRNNAILVKEQGESHDDAWTVCSNPTSRRSTGEEAPIVDKMGRCRWLAIELRSPVFWDAAVSYEETELVVNLVKSKYCLRVDAACGFHVGIGNGSVYFDTRNLKRIAAFLFAADPILSRLHVPWRRIGASSASIRYASQLACSKGVGASDADRHVQQMAEALLNEGCALDSLPLLPWSDQSRNEKDFGGKENWERHAHALVTRGPSMALSHTICPDPRQLQPFLLKPSRDYEDHDGGGRGRRFQSFMQTRMFKAACLEAFEHDRVDKLTHEEQCYVLHLAQCQILYGHMKPLNLTDSETRVLVGHCALYTENTWMTHQWNEETGRFEFIEARIGDQLDQPRPLAYNKINAPEVLANLARQVSSHHTSEGTSEGAISKGGMSSDGKYALSSGGPMPSVWETSHSGKSSDSSQFHLASPSQVESILMHVRDRSSRQPIRKNSGLSMDSIPSEGDYMPAAWRALYSAPPADGGNAPSEFALTFPDPLGDSSLGTESTSPFLSQGSALDRGSNGRSDNDKSSPPLLRHRYVRSEFITRVNKASKKLAPHDVSKLEQSYMDRVESIEDGSLLRYSWQRMPWLPGPDGWLGTPDPAPPHVFNEQVCGRDGSKCREHPVTDTLAGVAVITDVHSAAAMAYLLTDATASASTTSAPLNYDFRAYTASELSKTDFSGSETRMTGARKKRRHIVFREAAGSLDAEWIVTWTRICHGIVRFCRDASVFSFLLQLEKVEREEYRRRQFFADKNNAGKEVGIAYDVCDLLEDMGLFAEAAVVRDRETQLGPPR